VTTVPTFDAVIMRPTQYLVRASYLPLLKVRNINFPHRIVSIAAYHTGITCKLSCKLDLYNTCSISYVMQLSSLESL